MEDYRRVAGAPAMEEIRLIEYLKDKVYLGAYDEEPAPTANRVYFTTDDIEYNNFHHDFGPLTAAHLYRFAVRLHETLGDPAHAGKAVVYYSPTNPRDRANAACMLSCYLVLMQGWAPHLALAPIAQAEPPFMPFRDAGYSVADFVLTIQDIVYGVWRAKENKFLDIKNFNLEEYEHFERVENGDLNLVGPHFVAFASPMQDTRDYDRPISSSFRQVCDYFLEQDVKLVVRLNTPHYDETQFTRRGIKHVDLYFDDGTCPSMAYVQGFIGAAECVIRDKGKIAVHCRAGLGRTGCLIGAHLIYTYGFTAQEAIGYMRFLRPGMVVGPQQHWLYLHQNEFRDWRRTMALSRVADDSLAGLRPLVPLDTLNAQVRDAAASGASRSPSAAARDGSVPHTPERRILSQVTTNLPLPTPGQPRKSPSPARAPSRQQQQQQQQQHAASVAAAAMRQPLGGARRASKYVSMDPGPTNSDDEDDAPAYAGARRLGATDENENIARAIGKSRATSNPSPRRHRLFSGVGVDAASNGVAGTTGRTSRVASGVHK